MRLMPGRRRSATTCVPMAGCAHELRGGQEMPMRYCYRVLHQRQSVTANVQAFEGLTIALWR